MYNNNSPNSFPNHQGFAQNPNANLYPQIPSQYDNQQSPNMGGGMNQHTAQQGGGGASFVNFGAPLNAEFNNGPNVFQNIGGSVGMNALTEAAFTQFGSQFIGKGQSYVNSQYSQKFSMLKYYFNVNNSYVINKIKLLLFPLRHVYWKRRIQRNAEGVVFLPPRDDINAPDLYIPLMAFVTYVLIIGYVWGSAYKFTPDVLAVTASRALFALVFEIIIIKTGFYLLNSLTVPFLDIVAYSGYKNVGIVVTIIGGLFFGTYVFYGLLLATSLFMAIFMVNTFKQVFPDLSGAVGSGAHRRKYFLVAIGALQFLFNYYLDLSTHVCLLFITCRRKLEWSARMVVLFYHPR